MILPSNVNRGWNVGPLSAPTVIQLQIYPVPTPMRGTEPLYRVEDCVASPHTCLSLEWQTSDWLPTERCHVSLRAQLASYKVPVVNMELNPHRLVSPVCPPVLTPLLLLRLLRTMCL